MNCENCDEALRDDGYTRACDDGRGCPIPQPDAAGVRALDLRAKLVALPCNISGGWLLDRLGASAWDVEMICAIESVVGEVKSDG